MATDDPEWTRARRESAFQAIAFYGAVGRVVVEFETMMQALRCKLAALEGRQFNLLVDHGVGGERQAINRLRTIVEARAGELGLCEEETAALRFLCKDLEHVNKRRNQVVHGLAL